MGVHIHRIYRLKLSCKAWEEVPDGAWPLLDEARCTHIPELRLPRLRGAAKAG